MFTDTKNSRRTKADVLTIKFCQKVPHLQSFFQIVILHQFWKSGTRWRQNMEVISHSLTPCNIVLHMHSWYAQPCLPKKFWQVPCFLHLYKGKLAIPGSYQLSGLHLHEWKLWHDFGSQAFLLQVLPPLAILWNISPGNSIQGQLIQIHSA